MYDYATLNTNANKVVLSSSFFDTSTPQRLVAVRSAEDVVYKFEFSEDNSTFVPNPNIDLQEFYKYKFDTSHSSLTGTYFDISPSSNYNLITVEKIESTILPAMLVHLQMLSLDLVLDLLLIHIKQKQEQILQTSITLIIRM